MRDRKSGRRVRRRRPLLLLWAKASIFVSLPFSATGLSHQKLSLVIFPSYCTSLLLPFFFFFLPPSDQLPNQPRVYLHHPFPLRKPNSRLHPQPLWPNYTPNFSIKIEKEFKFKFWKMEKKFKITFSKMKSIFMWSKIEIFKKISKFAIVLVISESQALIFLNI